MRDLCHPLARALLCAALALVLSDNTAVASASNLRDVATATAASCDTQYQVWNATTRHCDCRDGFHGVGCQMCDSTATCQHALQDHVGTISCRSGLTYSTTSDHKTYQCQVNADQDDLPVKNAVTMQCDRTHRTCSIDVIAPTSLHCALSSCSFEDGWADVQCKHSACVCQGNCTSSVQAVTAGSFAAVLQTTGDSHISFNIEDAGFFMPMTCSASACEVENHQVRTVDGIDGPDAASASTQQIIRVVVYSLCGLLLLMVLWCGCYWKSCLAEFQHWNRHVSVCSTIGDTESEVDPQELLA